MYKDEYKHIRADVIDVSKALVGRKETSIYRLPQNEALNRMKIWLTYVSEMYQITLPTLAIVSPEECYENGCYIHEANTIKLLKVSVVTLFHEFKHCMDVQKNRDANEDKARGWSMSLFNAVNPRLCDKAIRDEKVFFQ
jgi:hypothetical protein